MDKHVDKLYRLFLSKETKERSEHIIIKGAIISFLLHLLLIGLVDFGLIGINKDAELLTNPIAAIYTPFSFILIYEVYLLVYYIPKSITTYIRKQYEIITLIVIRSVFKDLANLELSKDWFQYKYDVQLIYDILATLLLFFLIYLFSSLDKRRQKVMDIDQTKLKNFIQLKQILSLVLVPVLVVLATVSFSTWIFTNFFSIEDIVNNMGDVNKIFYDDFFTILILTDVLLLLFSFTQTDYFPKVIRNSGFIISTILIKISFSTEGLLNTVLIVTAVLFGVLILWIHNQYLKLQEES